VLCPEYQILHYIVKDTENTKVEVIFAKMSVPFPLHKQQKLYENCDKACVAKLCRTSGGHSAYSKIQKALSKAKRNH
jgi:hypothetical protein